MALKREHCSRISSLHFQMSVSVCILFSYIFNGYVHIINLYFSMIFSLAIFCAMVFFVENVVLIGVCRGCFTELKMLDKIVKLLKATKKSERI